MRSEARRLLDYAYTVFSDVPEEVVFTCIIQTRCRLRLRSLSIQNASIIQIYHYRGTRTKGQVRPACHNQNILLDSLLLPNY